MCSAGRPYWACSKHPGLPPCLENKCPSLWREVPPAAASLRCVTYLVYRPVASHHGSPPHSPTPHTHRYIISSDGSKVRRTMALFVAASIPAAVVNSGLKYMQKRIKLAFQRRLTLQLHELYCNNRAYFAASTLRGLTGADQRITEDVEKFTYAISELYSYTFKPLLDVVLFTHSLSGIMG